MEMQLLGRTKILGREIECYGSWSNTLFLAKDVAEWIGHKNVSKMLMTVDEDEKVKAKIATPSNICVKWFLTEQGLKTVLANSRKTQSIELMRFVDNKHEFIRKAVETEFLNQLEQALQPFGIKGEPQHSVGKYRIDYYIKDVNVAIEYDENNHKNYSYEQQELRQQLIEQELGCKFIRVSDKNSHAYNIGLIIKEIFCIKPVRCATIKNNK